MSDIAATKIEQGGLNESGEPLTLLIGVASYGTLRGHVRSDMWAPDNKDGYQRPLEPRRTREIGRYVTDDQGTLPTSILLAIRPDDLPAATIDVKGDHATIHVPDGAPLWIVDGQHRFGGIDDLYQRTQDERLLSYMFPISVMWQVDRFAEMRHFNIINTTQKKMATDIVDRHLVLMQQQRGIQMVSQGTKGEKEYARATATRIVDAIDQADGPWQNQIRIPGVAGRDRGLLRQHAFVASLEPVLKDSWMRGRTDEDKTKVIVNFWKAAQEAWPEAFEDAQAHRVQATVGIYSLHMVLPIIIQRCVEARDLTPEKMAELLRATKIKSDFWSKESDNPWTLGTGMSSIRALAQYLISLIPAAAGAGVRM